MEKPRTWLKPNLKKHRNTVDLTLLALPAILFVFIYYYIPLYGLVLPFKDYSPVTGFFKSPWVGLKNFQFLIHSDVLWQITRNTLGMNALFFIANTVFSVIFALFLVELSKKFVKFYQNILFLPYFMSWVIVTYLFLGFLEPDKGIINKVLAFFGGDPIFWYNEAKYWPFILLFIYTWKMTGYGAVIYYAGLISIDPEYYEAAAIDGATKFQQIRYISIPLLLPLIIVINVLAIGRIFYGDIGLFYNVTLNSPFLYPTTDVIDTYVIRSLQTMNDLGMASAAGFYQSVCGFVLVLLTNVFVKKIDQRNALF